MSDFYSRLQGKSQVVQDELVRLGEQMVNGVEGTRALALELCREFEDKFLQHIGSGEVGLLFYLFTLIYFRAYFLSPYFLSFKLIWR